MSLYLYYETYENFLEKFTIFNKKYLKKMKIIKLKGNKYIK